MDYVKKLMIIMAITMLVIFTVTTVTVSEQKYYCSPAPPEVPSGVCKDDYANCVANLITLLRDRTPHVENQTFTTDYPVNGGTNGVMGFGMCVSGCSFSDCKSCLFDGYKWFHQNCPSSSTANYYEANCLMSYSEKI
ncbi:hypothetical protein LINGRAHAP2_LOCUS34015 [Linum grandiflorum]